MPERIIGWMGAAAYRSVARTALRTWKRGLSARRTVEAIVNDTARTALNRQARQRAEIVEGEEERCIELEAMHTKGRAIFTHKGHLPSNRKFIRTNDLSQVILL